MAAVILPIFGIALWFPFSNADTDGTVSYRSTELLYYNEYWYEYENVAAGNQITYSVQSSISTISFAIWDRPFESIPTTTVLGSDSDTFPLAHNDYEYFWIFLKPGSSIDFDFNATGLVDFFIADVNQLIAWNDGGSPSFYMDLNDVTNGTGTFNIISADDYYCVWYNEGGSSVTVEYIIDFSAAEVKDFSAAPVNSINVDNVPVNNFNVPTDGNWYFFVFFEPMNSPEESTWITFDVSYSTGVTSTNRWMEIMPILIIIALVFVAIIIIAVVARRGQKRMAQKYGQKGEAAKPKESVKAEPTTEPVKPKGEPKKAITTPTQICQRCGTDVKSDAIFCHSCGGKIEGRQVVSSLKYTPADAKTCSFCKSKLKVGDNFCKWCGTKIEK